MFQIHVHVIVCTRCVFTLSNKWNLVFSVVLKCASHNKQAMTRNKFRPSCSRMTIHVFTDGDSQSVKDRYLPFGLNSVRVLLKRRNNSCKNKHFKVINQIFRFLHHFELIILRGFRILNYLAFF